MHEDGGNRVIDATRLIGRLGLGECLPARAQEIELTIERRLEKRDEPIERRHRRGADQQLVGRRVPQNRDRLAAQIAAVLRLVFEAILGVFPGLAFLLAAGEPARIAGGQRTQLDLVIGAQRSPGTFTSSMRMLKWSVSLMTFLARSNCVSRM